MGKGYSPHERAALLSGEILDDFSKGVKLSVLLQKSSLLARLVGDAGTAKWINNEIGGIFYSGSPEGLSLLYRSGRVWGSQKYLDHVEVLETGIEARNQRMKSAIDPNVSVASANPSQYLHIPQGNTLERTTIQNEIRIYQSILSRIKGSLHKFVSDANYVLNFTEIANEVFTELRKGVEANLAALAPDVLGELVTAYQQLESKQSSNWSNVASGCRRVLMQIADVVYPPSAKSVEGRDGKKHVLNALAYRLRLREFLLGGSQEGAVARDTSEYVFELLDSVDRLNAKGDKNPIPKSTAQKILIFTYLLLQEIFERRSPAP